MSINNKHLLLFLLLSLCVSVCPVFSLIMPPENLPVLFNTNNALNITYNMNPAKIGKHGAVITPVFSFNVNFFDIKKSSFYFKLPISGFKTSTATVSSSVEANIQPWKNETLEDRLSSFLAFTFRESGRKLGQNARLSTGLNIRLALLEQTDPITDLTYNFAISSIPLGDRAKLSLNHNIVFYLKYSDKHTHNTSTYYPSTNFSFSISNIPVGQNHSLTITPYHQISQSGSYTKTEDRRVLKSLGDWYHNTSKLTFSIAGNSKTVFSFSSVNTLYHRTYTLSGFSSLHLPYTADGVNRNAVYNILSNNTATFKVAPFFTVKPSLLFFFMDPDTNSYTSSKFQNAPSGLIAVSPTVSSVLSKTWGGLFTAKLTVYYRFTATLAEALDNARRHSLLIQASETFKGKDLVATHDLFRYGYSYSLNAWYNWYPLREITHDPKNSFYYRLELLAFPLSTPVFNPNIRITALGQTDAIPFFNGWEDDAGFIRYKSDFCSYLRGIPDSKLESAAASADCKSQTATIINLNLPFMLPQFTPHAVFYINPFADFAMFTDLNQDAIPHLFATAGCELIAHLAEFQKFPIRASFGVNLLSDVFEYEFSLGLNLLY